MADTKPATETLLEFPCDFPIKVMGLANNALAQAVLDVVLRHDPGFDGASLIGKEAGAEEVRPRWGQPGGDGAERVDPGGEVGP